jgi:hypothetical protein
MLALVVEHSLLRVYSLAMESHRISLAPQQHTVEVERLAVLRDIHLQRCQLTLVLVVPVNLEHQHLAVGDQQALSGSDISQHLNQVSHRQQTLI